MGPRRRTRGARAGSKPKTNDSFAHASHVQRGVTLAAGDRVEYSLIPAKKSAMAKGQPLQAGDIVKLPRDAPQMVVSPSAPNADASGAPPEAPPAPPQPSGAPSLLRNALSSALEDAANAREEAANANKEAANARDAAASARDAAARSNRELEALRRKHDAAARSNRDYEDLRRKHEALRRDYEGIEAREAKLREDNSILTGRLDASEAESRRRDGKNIDGLDIDALTSLAERLGAATARVEAARASRRTEDFLCPRLRRGHSVTSRRRRGCDVDIPWTRVAAPPRLRPENSVETGACLRSHHVRGDERPGNPLGRSHARRGVVAIRLDAVRRRGVAAIRLDAVRRRGVAATRLDAARRFQPGTSARPSRCGSRGTRPRPRRDSHSRTNI